jgi:hypothetical protein
VASLEQRVERVEVHVDAHQQLLTDLRTGLRQFEARVDARFAQIDGRFLALDQKVDAVRHEMAFQFRWLVGLMLTGMATIAAAILAG